jgi:hypothetical protein
VWEIASIKGHELRGAGTLAFGLQFCTARSGCATGILGGAGALTRGLLPLVFSTSPPTRRSSIVLRALSSWVSGIYEAGGEL